jgi:hypothetical protein
VAVEDCVAGSNDDWCCEMERLRQQLRVYWDLGVWVGFRADGAHFSLLVLVVLI